MDLRSFSVRICPKTPRARSRRKIPHRLGCDAVSGTQSPIRLRSTIGNSRIGAIIIQNYKRTPLGMNHTPEIDNIDERVAHLVFSIQDRAWQIAERAGIPADECSLHNASIDDDLKGWCHDNAARLKAAKRAVRMIDGVWGISDLGHRITRRLLSAHPRRRGLRYDIEPRRPINVALLFGSTRQKIRNSVAV